ncbi:MAG: hypothetical protein AB7G93_06850 [Bdellovibrionales bacterium]
MGDSKSKATTAEALVEYVRSHDIFDPATISIETKGDGETLLMDFNPIDYLSSLQLRKFIMWCQALNEDRPDLRVVAQNVHARVLQSLSLFVELLPRELRIESVIVPYFCDPCKDVEASVGIMTSSLISKGGKQASLETFAPNCAKCNTKMLPDVDDNCLAVVRR